MNSIDQTPDPVACEPVPFHSTLLITPDFIQKTHAALLMERTPGLS